jgi:hypothetical protein
LAGQDEHGLITLFDLARLWSCSLNGGDDPEANILLGGYQRPIQRQSIVTIAQVAVSPWCTRWWHFDENHASVPLPTRPDRLRFMLSCRPRCEAGKSGS